MLIDKAELSKGLVLATAGLREGEVFELRVLPSGHSGTFRSAKEARAALSKLAAQLGAWDGAYFMPNPMKGEPTNTLKVGKAGRDVDVTRRRWLLLDVDPERPKVPFPGGGEGKASATDLEKGHAWELRARIVADLRDVWGFADPVMSDSGNGYHAMWAVDLPADSDVPERFLATLARVYDTDAAKVDRSVKNAARIWKLPGTLACKGPNLAPERPWRMARVESVLEKLHEVVPEAMSLMLEALEVAPEPAPVHRGGTASATFSEARERYKAERTPAWPVKVGTCPVCGHDKCFHVTPFDSQKWMCFSSNHEGGGRQTATGKWIGDVIDIDRHTSGKTERELLLSAGFLEDRPARRERGSAEPPVWASEVILEGGMVAGPARVERRDVAMRQGRVDIEVLPGELPTQVEASIAALANEPDLYTRVGVMVLAQRGPEGRQLVRVTKATARVMLERRARYLEVRRTKRGDEMVQVSVLDRITEAVLDPSDLWAGGLREVRAVHGVPVIRPNGDIVGEGYDAATQLLVDFNGQTFPEAGSTRREGEESLARLEDLLVDFPFEEPETLNRTVIVSMMLAAIVRRTLRVCPAYLVDSPSSSVGKNLLVDIASLLMVGRRATITSDPKDEDEASKKIFAALLSGRSHLAFDNISKPFGGEAFDSIMTGDTYDGRRLGVSEMVKVPANALVTITGRNVKFRGDGIYRTLRARMVTTLERPDKGRDFKHKELANYITENRGRLVADVLTVIRAYLLAGRPSRTPPIKEYSEWTAMAREPLIWLGRPDPAESIEIQRLETDEEMSKAAQVLAPWWDVYRDKPVSIAAVVDELSRVEYAENMSPAKVPMWELKIAIEDMMGDKISGARVSHGFSKRMGANAGRPIGGYVFKRAAKGKLGVRWQVVKLGVATDASAGPSRLASDEERELWKVGG